MGQKAKVSISISALFEPGQGFVLDAICNVFRIFTHYISHFVFVIGFYLNLVGDICKTFKLDFSIQFGIFMGRNMNYILLFVRCRAECTRNTLQIMSATHQAE